MQTICYHFNPPQFTLGIHQPKIFNSLCLFLFCFVLCFFWVPFLLCSWYVCERFFVGFFFVSGFIWWTRSVCRDVWKKLLFFRHRRGKEMSFSYFTLFSLFRCSVKAKFFKRMLLFSAAVALFKDFSSVFFFLFVLLVFFCFRCVRSVRRNLMMFRLTYFVFKLSVNPEIWTAYRTAAVGQWWQRWQPDMCLCAQFLLCSNNKMIKYVNCIYLRTKAPLTHSVCLLLFASFLAIRKVYGQ